MTLTATKKETRRAINFNPGPSVLPFEVLSQAQGELLDYRSTGMSVLEISHRSKEYEELNTESMNLLRELLGLDNSYHVLFLGGGASTQFSMLPMNFLSSDKTASYVNTGSWADKAIKEAKLFGNVHVAGSSKESSYSFIPTADSLQVPKDSQYLHITSNNTIYGTQWHWWPHKSSVPLFCDMSSDFCSRSLDYSQFALIYAGAQKNIGPAGVTVVLLHDSLLEKCNPSIPTMFDYRTHVKNLSLYNTPPVFAVYLMRLVLGWIKANGGLKGIEEINRKKQAAVYKVMDAYPDYYKGTVEKGSRSWMNVTLHLPSETLETKFFKEATQLGFVGLKGHRDVGGIRVSLYNAMSLDGVKKLVDFMKEFAAANR